MSKGGRFAALLHQEPQAASEYDGAIEYATGSSPEALFRSRPRAAVGFSLLAVIGAAGALGAISGTLPPSRWARAFLPVQKHDVPAARFPAAVDSTPCRGTSSVASSTCSYGDPFWSEYIDQHRQLRADLEMGGEGRFLIYDCTGSVDCGGLAGEFRSVAWALYASMITGRALFIRWERDGQDMADLMGMAATIDWRPPASLLEENCIDMERVKQTSAMNDLLHNDTVPCVRMFRALTKPLNLRMYGDNLSDFEDAGSAYNAWDTIVPTQSTYACAAHFLFTFTPAFESLLDNVELVVSPGSLIPDSFVAVHMRFGDGIMSGSVADEHNFSTVTKALACASALLQEVMSSETSWGIFFASDSTAARQFALASSSGHPVFTTGELPTHISQNVNASIWGSLGDFLMLASAQGLVQWTNPIGFALASGKPINVSTFSYIPAQLSFMPLDHMRILEKDVEGFAGCGPDVALSVDSRVTQARPAIL